ncbi:4-hydroxy-tetrahydrodipicolinate synthase [Fulvivirga kasyanovii]|uniref:4-hydroxy-tetrahydrodipicolinate synthase n=1 Tax=Fulvivirga kasyanovii TaxID=396812 RepID=A0ABW9RL71_9BACT|nr:4-hydroxy-tetrahydrodipicolinate synthase [Fulvivirga kasyanovii]MTI24847.1 4-hydroxy-tetrahydrodipicolinate synthase [Fulvivirga kasyanovii]
MHKLHGTGVALVTPFDSKGNIDFDGLTNLLKFTAEKGVDYYVVQGTTGESATISAKDKAEILKYTKQNNPHQLPIVYGIGGNNTEEVIKTIKSTDLDGVEAILSVSPYYNKPSQEGIYQHYIAIADASPVPVILYNVPGRTGSNISASTSLRLAKHKNIIGVKEASGNLEQAMLISRDKPEDFMLISGDDMLTVPLYAIGSVGVISVLANGFADIFKEMKDAAFANDYKKAAAAAFQLLEINPLMYSESNPVGIKQVLKEFGVCDNFVRLPLVSASEDLQAQISKAMHQMKAGLSAI